MLEINNCASWFSRILTSIISIVGNPHIRLFSSLIRGTITHWIFCTNFEKSRYILKLYILNKGNLGSMEIGKQMLLMLLVQNILWLDSQNQNFTQLFGPQIHSRLLLPWSVLRGGGSPTYSDYRFIKIHIPKIGSKFGPDKFRTNSGYMCFFNHITTVRGWSAAAQNAPWKKEPGIGFINVRDIQGGGGLGLGRWDSGFLSIRWEISVWVGPWPCPWNV